MARFIYPLLIVTLMGWSGPAWAQTTAPAPESAALVDLNRAIKAYLEQDRDAAAEIFQRLLTEQQQAEFRITCQYYLGLIALERGLGHSSAAQAATARQAPEEAAQAAAAARREYEQAQAFFGQVITVADPSAEMINAALLLGIAQLASDYKEAAEQDPEAPFKLARRAEETLSRYVTETEPGARDRYGHFYLAVARYRLADEYRGKPGRGREYGESVAAARLNLERAQALATADRDSGALSPEAFESFKTVVTYYSALLAILERNNYGARQLFTEVTTRAEGTELARNAAAIVRKLDEVESGTPLPIRLDVPPPIGPLEFEGRLRVGNAYDTNVILLGKDTQLPLGYKRQDDYGYGIAFDFNISRYIPKTEAPWVGESLTIGLGAGTQNLWHPNVSEFDVNRYPARAYVNWQPVRDLYLGFQYEYSYTQLGHDPYISSQRVTPVISKVWRDSAPDARDLGHTDFYYSHDDRSYMDRIAYFQLNRDGTYQSLGAQHTFNLWRADELPYMADYLNTHARARELFGQNWLSVYIGYEFRDEQTVGTEFDLSGHSLLCGVDVPLPYRFGFEFDAEFAWEDYHAASLFDFTRQERADFRQRYNFSLTYAIITRGEYAPMRTLDVKLRTGVELTFQNSNIWNRLGEDIYEYDRAIYGVQLEVGF
jgi:hypothetical protein